MNSFIVPNLPSPTHNGSSLVTNQMALKAWARVTFFLFSPFFLLYRRKKMPGRRKTGKNAPILSHEFVITNHGDIVSCICMVFMMGLMFQVRFSLFGGVV